MNPRVCPECVAEKGFIEAHWHLRLMTACPVHLRIGTTDCPVCGRKLRWFRPGLLDCKCGHSLLERLPPSISEKHSGLFAAIQSKVLGCHLDNENPSHLPLQEIMAMNLRSMLSLVRALGRQRLIASGNSTTDELEIVIAATEVLSDWPTNFIKLMRDLGQDAPQRPSGGVRAQFDGIYQALFKNRAIEPRDQTDFLRSVFLDFVVNEWGRGFVDRKLLARAPESSSRRFMTRSEFAAALGIQPTTAERLLKVANIPAERVRCGRAERIIVDASRIALRKTQPGRILRAREAARHLGLPVPVLSALRKTGEFETLHLSPVQPGWHEKDVDAFARKLLGLARPACTTGSEADQDITMAAIMQNRHHSVEVKAALVRALIGREVPVAIPTGGGIGDIQLNFQRYREWLAETLKRIDGDTSSAVEAAKVLRCDKGAIAGLIELGLLRGSNTLHGLRIDNESIKRFSEEHVPLASHAKRLRTNTRALMSICKRNGVPMLMVPLKRRAGPQPFIRVADLSKVIPVAA